MVAVAEDVLHLALRNILQQLKLHALILVALFQHDFVLVLINRVQRDQPKIILIAQPVIELLQVLDGLLTVDDAVELVVDDDDHTLTQDVVVAQILVD